MAKKNYNAQSKEKRILGELISKLRSEKNLSLRKFSEAIGLSPSNMAYIENGVNAPTAEIYQKIINVLAPNKEIQKKLDKLYTIVRKVPPPDVCDILIKNPIIGEKLKLLKDYQLTNEQLKEMEKLIKSFNDKVIKITNPTKENANDE